MNPSTSWKTVLATLQRGQHVAHVYWRDDLLDAGLTLLTAEGLRRGEGVAVVSTRAHRRTLLRELQGLGVEPLVAVRRGQLRLLDVRATLARVLPDGRLDRAELGRVLSRLVDPLAERYGSVRLHQGLADELTSRGDSAAAAGLEDVLAELLADRPVAIHCGHRLDPLADAAHRGPLQELCRAHTHLLPGTDYGRLDEAVARAADRVLAPRLAAMMRSLVAHEPVRVDMPAGLAMLLWLDDHMPLTAEKVRAGARDELAPTARAA